MKTLWIDCSMGAAGDMFMGALLDLSGQKDIFIDRLNRLGIPGITVTCETTTKMGVTGTHVRVFYQGMEEKTQDVPEHAHHHDLSENHHHDHTSVHSHSHDHAHTGPAQIHAILESLPVSSQVRRDAARIYEIIAEAESHAHGVSVDQVHFHEVGHMDAVTDIVGSCMLMEELSPELVLSTPIHVGSGHVHCAHGILPVPAPATAFILKDLPTYSGSIRGELCTPTGAALLRHFVHQFVSHPNITPAHTGHGMGTKDFEQPNCLSMHLQNGIS